MLEQLTMLQWIELAKFFEIDLDEQERKRAELQASRLKAMFDRLHKRQQEQT